jgi:hypothetical protein
MSAEGLYKRQSDAAENGPATRDVAVGDGFLVSDKDGDDRDEDETLGAYPGALVPVLVPLRQMLHFFGRPGKRAVALLRAGGCQIASAAPDMRPVESLLRLFLEPAGRLIRQKQYSLGVAHYFHHSFQDLELKKCVETCDPGDALRVLVCRHESRRPVRLDAVCTGAEAALGADGGTESAAA